MWTHDAEESIVQTDVITKGETVLEVVEGTNYEQVRRIVDLKCIALTDQRRRIIEGQTLTIGDQVTIWFAHERNDQL